MNAFSHLGSALLALAGFTASSAIAETINVCAEGCEYTSINAAIAAAADGDLIQLAAETYREDVPIDTLGKAVILRGTTTPDGQPTSILDGSNAHRVMICQSGEDANTVISNLIIQNGLAQGDPKDPVTVSGSGLLVTQSGPTITNCRFRLNVGAYGGAILFFEECDSQVRHCQFEANTATTSGGGVYSYFSQPSIETSTFTRNAADYGGAIMFEGPEDGSFASPSDRNAPGMNIPRPRNTRMTGTGSNPPTVTNCIFRENQARYGGVAYDYRLSGTAFHDCFFIFNMSEVSAGAMFTNRANTYVDNCLFHSNSAQYGGAVYESGSNSTMIDCVFTSNAASLQGGAIDIQVRDSVPSSTGFLECRFEGNSADFFGGGVNTFDCDPLFVECDFINNDSGRQGGGPRIQGSASFDACTFLGNSATEDGGGIYVQGKGTTNFTNSTFQTNLATSGGGLFSRDMADPNIFNCEFSGNIAADSGGAITLIDGSSPVIRVTSFNQNSALNAGAILNGVDCNPFIIRCSFEGNTATDRGGVMENFVSGTPSFFDCLIKGNIAGIDGGAIVNLDGTTVDLENTLVCGNTGLQITGGYTDLGSGCVRDECLQADLNCDGIVDSIDLGYLLAAFGEDNPRCDLDGDGRVGSADLGILFALWGDFVDADLYQIDNNDHLSNVGAPGATISWGNAFQTTTPNLYNLGFGIGIRNLGNDGPIGNELIWQVFGAQANDPSLGLDLLDSGTHVITTEDWALNGELDMVDVNIDLTGYKWFFVVASFIDDLQDGGDAYYSVQTTNILGQSWAITAAIDGDQLPDFQEAFLTSELESPLLQGTWVIRGNVE